MAENPNSPNITYPTNDDMRKRRTAKKHRNPDEPYQDHSYFEESVEQAICHAGENICEPTAEKHQTQVEEQPRTWQSSQEPINELQQLIQPSIQQSEPDQKRRSEQELEQILEQVPEQQSEQVPEQQSGRAPEQLTWQQLEQQLEQSLLQQSVHQPTQLSPQVLMQELLLKVLLYSPPQTTQDPTIQPVDLLPHYVDKVQPQTTQDDGIGVPIIDGCCFVYPDPQFLGLLLAAESSIRSVVTNPANYLKLHSSHIQHRLSNDVLTTYQHLTYKPRRALVCQVKNMDHQTVISYGDDKLQFRDLADGTAITEWDGSAEGTKIEQVVPVSSSAVAIVSKANRLAFFELTWDTQQSRLRNMPLKWWVGGANSKDNISIVESADPDSDIKFQVSLFTGAKSGGEVYRRTFNFHTNTAETFREERMKTEHCGAISALCHLVAKRHVASGSTSGNICINDYKTGQRVQGFNLSEKSSVGGITHCSLNPNLFMVGCSQPKNKIQIFDTRLRLDRNNSCSLTLQDNSSAFLSRYSRPSWDSNSGMVFAPACRKPNFGETATVLSWDPRFARCGSANHFNLSHNKREVYSVDFAEPAAGQGRVMVTATEDAIGFTSVTIESL